METKENTMSAGLHLGFKIAKLMLKTASVVAAFLIVKELHKVHKGLEHHHK